MNYNSCTVSGTLSDLFARVSTSGQMTVHDRRGLKMVLLSDAIDEEVRLSVDRLLQGIRRGCIKLADEVG